MRFLALIVSFLLLLIQYPLWLGKGGWFHAWELDDQLIEQIKQNQILHERNRRLKREVQDLREEMNAIEERARFEMGMIKDGEYFVHIIPSNSEIK